MKLATKTGDFFDYVGSQTESIKLVHDAGFKYIDYSFGCDQKERTGVYSEKYKDHISAVAECANELGIKFVQAHAPMGRPLVDEGGVLLADTIRSVEACGAWGIKNLVVHSGYVKGISKEENFVLNKEFFLRVLEHAEKYDVNILVENFNKMTTEGLYWVDNAPDLLAMIEYVDHPLFHAIWDVGHANMQEMPQDEALRMLGSHVRALHIQDNMGTHDSHLMPFLGTLSLDAVMNGLIDIGYNGYFTFEVGGIFLPAGKRRPYERDTRLAYAPLELRIAAEKYLYTLGKCILETYDCFEE